MKGLNCTTLLGTDMPYFPTSRNNQQEIPHSHMPNRNTALM